MSGIVANAKATDATANPTDAKANPTDATANQTDATPNPTDAKALATQLLAFVETMKKASDVLMEYDRVSTKTDAQPLESRPPAGMRGSIRNQSTYYWPSTLR